MSQGKCFSHLEKILRVHKQASQSPGVFRLLLWCGKLTAGEHQRQVCECWEFLTSCSQTYGIWRKQMNLLTCNFVSPAPPPIPRVSVWNRARKQCRRLCEAKLPRDARVHATVQRPCNPRWSGVSQVSLCMQQQIWSLDQNAQQWDSDGFPALGVTYPTKQPLKESGR